MFKVVAANGYSLPGLESCIGRLCVGDYFIDMDAGPCGLSVWEKVNGGELVTPRVFGANTESVELTPENLIQAIAYCQHSGVLPHAPGFDYKMNFIEGRNSLRSEGYELSDNVNFLDFSLEFSMLHQSHASEKFLREQFDLLKAGVRDSRIHDTAFNAWRKIGLEAGV